MATKTVIALTALIVLISSSCLAGQFRLGYGLLWSPPGYDRVTSGGVDVGSAFLTPTLEWENIRLSVETEAAFTTDWQPSDERGHGFEKFTSAYAWTPKRTLWSSTIELEVGPKKMHLFVKFYKPWNRHDPEGWNAAHGRETNYYGQIGVAGEIPIFDF